MGLVHLAVLSTGDLNVSGMVRNRHLARAISCTGWAEFRRMLAYKCGRHRRQLAVVDRWYPSSKTCSACGHLLAELDLSVRTWMCPACGTRHDRDINAAKNILAAGLAAGAGKGADACGGAVKRTGATRAYAPGKQEPQRATAGIPAQ
jgi:putative transposase